MLSYKHAGIFKNMREVHREASRTSRVFLKIPACLYNTTKHEDEVFYFFYKNAKEIARAQTRDASSVHYNSIKHACDISRVLYGALMNSNWPITARAISQTFYNRQYYIKIIRVYPTFSTSLFIKIWCYCKWLTVFETQKESKSLQLLTANATFFHI